MDYLVAAIIFIAANLLAISGMLLVRKNIAIATLESHHEVAGFIYAVVGLIYGVILAFIVSVVWNQYTEAEERVAIETSIISSLYNSAEALPDSLEKEFKLDLKAYTRSVIDEEFEAMAKSESLHYNYYYSRIKNRLHSSELFNANYHYSNLASELNRLTEARRLRMITANFSVPVFMWFIMILGAIITIGYSYFFATKNVLAQGLMVISLTSIITLAMILIYALDHPFTGIIKITPELFEKALRN